MAANYRRKIAINLSGVIEDTLRLKKQLCDHLGISYEAALENRVEFKKAFDQHYQDADEWLYHPNRLAENAPVEGAKKGLEALSQWAVLYLVSSRANDRKKREPLETWLNAHEIDKFFERVLLFGKLSKEELQDRGLFESAVSIRKYDWCAEEEIDAFIEDDINDLQPGNDSFSGLRILFRPPEYSPGEVPKGVIRTESWDGIVQTLEEHLKPKYIEKIKEGEEDPSQMAEPLDLRKILDLIEEEQATGELEASLGPEQPNYSYSFGCYARDLRVVSFEDYEHCQVYEQRLLESDIRHEVASMSSSIQVRLQDLDRVAIPGPHNIEDLGYIPEDEE